MNNDCGDIDAYGTMDEGFTVCWVYRSLARNAKQFPWNVGSFESCLHWKLPSFGLLCSK